MSTTRDKILSAFEKHPHLSLSGAVLAKKLGLSRAGVWKPLGA